MTAAPTWVQRFQLMCLLAQCRPEGDCMIWQRGTDNNGYGLLNWHGRHTRAHRLALALATGRDLDGVPATEMALHGPCRNPRCLNTSPDHGMRWGTASDNARDAVRDGTHAMTRRTHCPHGHPYDDTNTRIDRRGKRHCRACARDRRARRAAERMLARLSRLDYLALEMLLDEVSPERLIEVAELLLAHPPGTDHDARLPDGLTADDVLADLDGACT